MDKDSIDKDVEIQTAEDAIEYLEDEQEMLECDDTCECAADEDDKKLLTDYCYYVMRRYFKIVDLDAFKLKQNSGPSLVCAYCCHNERPRIFAYREKKTCSKCFTEFGKHSLECPNTPERTRNALLLLKVNHNQQVIEKLRGKGEGNQSEYIRKLWKDTNDALSVEKVEHIGTPIRTKKEALRYLESANKELKKLVSPHTIKKLAAEESDKFLLSDYTFHVMKQYFHLQKRGLRNIDYVKGVPVLHCGHCVDHGKPKAVSLRKFSVFVKHFGKFRDHLMKCKGCPRQTLVALKVLKQTHENQMIEGMATGAQTKYVKILWDRIVSGTVEAEIAKSDSEVDEDEPEMKKRGNEVKIGTKERHEARKERIKNASIFSIKDALNYFHSEEKRRKMESCNNELKRAVTKNDEDLLSTFSYHVLNQYYKLDDKDQKRTSYMSNNSLLLLCSHCYATPREKVFTYTALDTLTKNYTKLGEHLIQCIDCPEPTKGALLALKQHHYREIKELRLYSNRANGSLSHKQYFTNLWEGVEEFDGTQEAEPNDKIRQNLIISIDFDKSTSKATIDVSRELRKSRRSSSEYNDKITNVQNASSTANTGDEVKYATNSSNLRKSKRSISEYNEKIASEQKSSCTANNGNEVKHTTNSSSVRKSKRSNSEYHVKIASEQKTSSTANTGDEVEHATNSSSVRKSSRSCSEYHDKIASEQKTSSTANTGDEVEHATNSGDVRKSGRSGSEYHDKIGSEQKSSSTATLDVKDELRTTINSSSSKQVTSEVDAQSNHVDDTTHTTRKSSRQKRKLTTEGIGDVGYCFTKCFNSRGILNGMVVEILPDKGMCRICA